MDLATKPVELPVDPNAVGATSVVISPVIMEATSVRQSFAYRNRMRLTACRSWRVWRRPGC